MVDRRIGFEDEMLSLRCQCIDARGDIFVAAAAVLVGWPKSSTRRKVTFGQLGSATPGVTVPPSQRVAVGISTSGWHFGSLSKRELFVFSPSLFAMAFLSLGGVDNDDFSVMSSTKEPDVAINHGAVPCR
jgi:hypothetical protein